MWSWWPLAAPAHTSAGGFGLGLVVVMRLAQPLEVLECVRAALSYGDNVVHGGQGVGAAVELADTARAATNAGAVGEELGGVLGPLGGCPSHCRAGRNRTSDFAGFNRALCLLSYRPIVPGI